jgi:hypothetical protein
LLRQQPVHGGIEFILGRGIEMEEFGERAAEGIGVKGTGGGEFGSRFENAGNDHGHDQIELAAGMFVDEGVEVQTVQGTEDGGHVAMGAGADDVEGLRQRGAEGSRAFQDGAECVDFGRRPMGDVGEGAVEDLAVEAEGFAEEDGRRGVAVGYGGDVHAYIISLYITYSKHNYNYYMTT